MACALAKWLCVATLGLQVYIVCVCVCVAPHALVATMGGLPQAVGDGWPQLAMMVATIWRYVCYLPPVVCTRASLPWVVATMGGRGKGALLALVGTMGG